MDTIGCRIELLGELRVVHGDRAISRFRTQKSAGLAAYLAVFLNQVDPRERIADLFWPDLDPEAGRQNLTTALTSLRRQLESIGLPAQDVLVSDRHTVRLNPACVTTDLDAFDRLLNAAAAERDPVNRARLLSSAIALYRSEPLPGRYEEWLWTFRNVFSIDLSSAPPTNLHQSTRFIRIGYCRFDLATGRGQAAGKMFFPIQPCPGVSPDV